MFQITRNRAWYFHLFQSLFQFCFETTEMFGLGQFSSCFSPFHFFPFIIHCFSVSKHQKWGLVFSPFPELVSILFGNVSKQLKRLDLVKFLSCFSLFQFFPYIIHCFSVLKHHKWGLVFSPFSELVSILFQNVSKQLNNVNRLNLVDFLHVSIFSLYNPLFQCFETPEMGSGIFTFSRVLFHFILKHFKTAETF